MGEAVTESVPGQAGTGTQEKFVSEKVWVCPSCMTTNPEGAARCSGCGGARESGVQTVDTVAATCPNCNRDRPLVPETGGYATGYNPDGSLKTVPETPEHYHGDCPHCQQTAGEANDALEKLKKGDSSQWGKGAAQH